ncbi:MAG: hypothetical protein A2Z47_11470 [Thermodesulfovibrio sp. RBG_19FT_COMBO_42_12]|nr:MAG: hypothetical protein A2Z47_11470 [Thermodesulfovibrio sp. RBG_19FT_COMBO_42_12]
MALDERKNHTLVFIGQGSVPQLVIEEGDEVTIYHEGNLIMATVKTIKANQIVGLITRSAYDPDLRSDFITGKEIIFSEVNIFGVSKKKTTRRTHHSN